MLFQIDRASLRDVCSEYGVVRACHAHYPSEVALVCFSSIEEAVQAKTGLDKNPSISGVQVSAEFASEAGIKDLCEQFELSIDTASSTASAGDDEGSEGTQENRKQGGWPEAMTSAPAVSITTTAECALPAISKATPLSLSEINSSSSRKWGDGSHHHHGPAHFARQESERSTTSTPGSMWSDGGFLSGFSSPWLSSVPTSLGGGGSPSSSSTAPISMTSSSSQEEAGLQLSRNGQSFLPGN